MDIFDLNQDDNATKRIKRKMYENDRDLEGFRTPHKRRRGGSSRSSSASPGPSKGKGKAGASKSEGPSDAIIATWRRGDDDLEPSTKMLALVEYLKEWDSTGDKTICYSQCRPYSPNLMIYLSLFSLGTSMLDLIETLFSRHGIRSLRFDGTMDRFERDATLATFKQIGGPKVILIR